MNQFLSSKFYTTYHGLSFHDKIRFFSDNINLLDQIGFEEWVDISIDHALVLFELGKYEKFLYLVDDLIETIVKENIYNYRGKDIFEELLFRKAASNYNLEEYQQAETLVLQLMKINNDNNVYKLLYAKIIKRKLFHTKKFLRLIGVVLVLLSIFLKVMDIFIIDPFYNQYHIVFFYIYSAMGIAGILIYLYDYLGFMFRKEGIFQ